MTESTTDIPANEKAAPRSTKRRMARGPKTESASQEKGNAPAKARSAPIRNTSIGPRGPSKIASVIALLERENGASLAEMVQATGWLPHTTRAALTGLKKKGHTIVKSKIDGVARYSIASAEAQ